MTSASTSSDCSRRLLRKQDRCEASRRAVAHTSRILFTEHEFRQSLYGSDERRKGCLHSQQIFLNKSGLEFNPISVTDEVTKTLQFAQALVEFLVDYRGPKSINFRRHLIEEILVSRFSGWHATIDVLGNTQKDVFDAIVDVVDTKRNRSKRGPFTRQQSITVYRVIPQRLFQLPGCSSQFGGQTGEDRILKAHS